jgi:peptidoglycan hydrolase-like protein with peptidoglycan-binding domain
MSMPPIALIWLLLLSAPFTPLKPGVQGPVVAALQTELTNLRLAPGGVDGYYGPNTAAAVARLEAAEGLPQDGQAGAPVLGGIVAKVAATAPLLQAGDSGAAVTDLQALLSADGFTVQADGSFGPATQSAVRALQTQRGLKVDGLAGPATWAAIFERSYTVQPGDAIDRIAQTYGASASALLSENGGRTLIVPGQKLYLPYAGAAFGTVSPGTSAAGSGGQSANAASTTAPPGGAGTQAKPSGGDSKLIPGRTLAQWGGAGTPEIGVVAVAEDASSALALRHSLPQGILLALPASLYSLGGSSQALLATSKLSDVRRTGAKAVLWQGPLPGKTLTALNKGHVQVLVAAQYAPAAALTAATGGGVLAVTVRRADLAALSTLARGLAHAGYRLTSPLP